MTTFQVDPVSLSTSVSNTHTDSDDPIRRPVLMILPVLAGETKYWFAELAHQQGILLAFG